MNLPKSGSDKIKENKTIKRVTSNRSVNMHDQSSWKKEKNVKDRK